MRRITKYRHSTITISIIIICVLVLSHCINNTGDKAEVIRKVNTGHFAGSATCAGCHKDIYESFIHTLHHLSSVPASEKSIKGSFETGKNTFAFNSFTTVAMEKRDSGYFQVQYENGIEKKARRFDIVIGSATKGQSYLYWWKNSLFQLPITYFTPANQWSNSPGYPDKVAFGRPITSRCLECHSTYVETISAPDAELEVFDPNKIIYAVECEKCHGPASQHVQFQTQHPNETRGMYIFNPVLLSRRQNLDLCSLCHGGRLKKTRPSFEFQAGDTLENYFSIDTAAKNAANIDVHGNQSGLLAASKCFRMSQMTCMSCHDAHKYERGDLALFSQRCATCHNSGHGSICKMSATLGTVISKNCIDCHMPKQPSGSIAVLLQGAEIPMAALMRTHFIKIYPDETNKFLSTTKKMRAKSRG